jgi:thioredoxin reductase
MTTPARNTLAVVGAGPVGLEAAALALEHGLDVHVFERGDVGSHVLAWGHVRMFTPWRMNVGPASARLLARHGWTAPDPDAHPTGAEFAERLLQPLAAVPELAARVHTHEQVVYIARRGALKHEWPGEARRRDFPFRLLVRNAGGHESVLHAFRVIDASGTYGCPNPAGSGGIPARGEPYLAPQMSYRCDDVVGLRRERHAGRRTLVIGGGATAATTATALAALADEAPGTTAVWAMRQAAGPLAGELDPDPLPQRAMLFAAARRLREGGHAAVSCVPGVEVDGFEFNSATHRYRVALTGAAGTRVEEVDEVVVNTGYGPDNSLYRELQVHECHAWRGPGILSAALMAAGEGGDGAPASVSGLLAHPEPDFWILGAKSFGRHSGFLLATGYAQVAEVVP